MRGLMRWAKAVADGEPLADAAAAGDHDDRPHNGRPRDGGDAGDSARRDRLLDQFRLLADIADAHRQFAQDTDRERGHDAGAADPARDTSSTASPAPSSAPRGARMWGHLELRGLIGRGAFGEVYEAWDQRLERRVALKLLYRDHDDGAAIAEGRLLARVRHPHVVSVFGADRIDGRVGIWMELIAGRTLEEIVAATGPLSAQEATLVGLDTCRALAAVHQAGLLHRDIKPRNLMREHGGRIVLMDFGAGRHHHVPRDADDPAIDASAIAGASAGAGAGTADLVGTPRYLAPEIFDGAPASVRSDLYSLGVLLFYLVTGTTPVGGDTPHEVRQEHRVERRARLREARPDLPEEFIAAVQRALAPDPNDRPASAAEFAESLMRAGTAGVTTFPERRAFGGLMRRGRGLAIGAVAAAGIALGVAAGVFATRMIWPATSARPQEARLLIGVPGISVDGLAASPDGRQLAITGVDASGTSRLWLRAIDAFGLRPVAGSEGATGVFWSADGSALGFFARQQLWIVSASGGAPRALCEAPNPRGGTWNRAGVIVFAATTSGPLMRIAASGGTPTPITTIDHAAGEIGHRWPTFLPDGSQLLFLAIGQQPSQTATFLTTLNGGGGTRRIGPYRSNVQPTGSGRLLFADGPVLLAQDERRGSGEPRAIARDLVTFPDRRLALFTWSPAGLLAYGAGEPLVTELTAYSRAGAAAFTRRVPGGVRSFSLSPDGTRLLLERLDPDAGSNDIWMLDLHSEMLERLTFDPANDTDPIWSPDGREVLFSSNRLDGTYHLFRRPSHPGGTDEPFSRASGPKFAEDWTADGRQILIVGGDEGARRIYTIPRDAPSKPQLLVNAGNGIVVDEPAFSPDGRSVAYHSTESGQPEIFVTSIADPSTRRQVSRGGVQPRWRGDGRELFYLSLDGNVMAVSIDSMSPWRVSAPRPLVRANAAHGLLLNDYAARADGQQFVVKKELGGTVSQVRVVLNPKE